MASSFVSEHSIEYVLVPQFAEILSSDYKTVIPIYFWHSREGGNISKDCFKNKFVRIVALYARRPKISSAYQESIYVKFNEVLFERARMFKEKGILVFAGVPVISSLDFFTLDTKCDWFSLKENGFEEIIEISCHNHLPIQTKSINQVNKKEILNQIRDQSELLKWPDAINFLRELRHRSDYIKFYSYMGDTYKPTFFLMPV